MTFKTALLIISSLTCTSFGAPASVQDTKSGDTKDMPVLGTPEKLHGGFEFTEGPTPDLEGNVYFTDIPAERIHIHRPDGTLETFMTESGKCNGLMFDADGHLWACQGGEGRVVRIDIKSKEITPVAARIDGGTFLSTNDLVLDAHGGAYFTDPAYWRHADSKVDEGVYYVDSEGEITRIAEKLLRPNGILLSPDGNTLYILPTGEQRLIAHPVLSPGKVGPGRGPGETRFGRRRVDQRYRRQSLHNPTQETLCRRVLTGRREDHIREASGFTLQHLLRRTETRSPLRDGRIGLLQDSGQ